jgi:hypothetical protein
MEDRAAVAGRIDGQTFRADEHPARGDQRQSIPFVYEVQIIDPTDGIVFTTAPMACCAPRSSCTASDGGQSSLPNTASALAAGPHKSERIAP